jgi:hypothetical protein
MTYIKFEDCPKDAEGRPIIPPGFILEPEHRSKPKATTAKANKQTATKGDKWIVLNAWVDVSIRDLSRAEIVTWLILFRDEREGISKTSQTDIARRGGLSSRSVATAVSSLLKKRLIKLIRRGGLRQGPSVYKVKSLMK